VTLASDAPGVLEVHGLTSDQIGTTADSNGLTLYELTPQHASLEEAFMELTRDAVEYHAGEPAGAARSTS